MLDIPTIQPFSIWCTILNFGVLWFKVKLAG